MLINKKNATKTPLPLLNLNKYSWLIFNEGWYLGFWDEVIEKIDFLDNLVALKTNLESKVLKTVVSTLQETINLLHRDPIIEIL